MLNEDKIPLASDNTSPAHPTILEALVQANLGPATAYGGDSWTERAEQLICQVLQAKPKILFLPSGTAANILNLKIACRSHESVICTDIAHLHHESGGPEAVVGCKLLSVQSHEGKLSCEEVMKKIESEKAFGKHTTSPRVLSITQPTEVGTVYSLKELKKLRTLCNEKHLLLHMDGSRIYNAAAALNCSLADIVSSASVDFLSLGGTKNGLIGAEAIALFNPAFHEGVEHMHKQALSLLSKMRYLSAQYIPFFETNLWHTLASQANSQAKKLASFLEKIPSISLNYPVQTNQLFLTVPESWIPLIQEKIFCFVWDKPKCELRFITSWNISDQQIEEIQSLFSRLEGFSK